MMWKLNTSNPGKLAEYQKLFNKFGQTLEASTLDLPEIAADPLTVIVHKASQVDEGIIVEDTSLDVEGISLGINIRWMLDHLNDCIGHKALWNVFLAYNKDDKVYVYQGQVKGKIASSRGEGGFGFDPHFVPEGHEKTLAEAKPDDANARALAVEALLNNKPFAIKDVIKEWEGEWQ